MPIQTKTQGNRRQSHGARIDGKGTASADGPGPDLMATAALYGNKVLSSDGKDIGEIKDIMLDVRPGRVAYAVLSSGGFLGIGDKLLATPWRTLRLDTQQKCFVLAMTAERVKNAPGFDKDHWPSMADQTWATSVHQHYGSEPYWGRDPFDRRDDLGVGEIVGCAGSWRTEAVTRTLLGAAGQLLSIRSTPPNDFTRGRQNHAHQKSR